MSHATFSTWKIPLMFQSWGHVKLTDQKATLSFSEYFSKFVFTKRENSC